MKLILDILQGMGLASAAGVRPFLPVLAAGAFASADVGVDFDGTAFAFLESPVFLLAVAIAMVLTFVAPRAPRHAGGRRGAVGHRDRLRRDPVRRRRSTTATRSGGRA